MYCVHCGGQLESEDAFCSRCGQPVSKEKIISPNPPAMAPREVEVSSESDLEEAFVGKKYDFYSNKWSILERKKSKTSWNWAAFFLGPFWFGYRKMYIPVILIAICYFLLDLFLYLTQYQYSQESYFYDPVENIMLFPLTIVFSLFGNYYYQKHTNRLVDKVNLQPFNQEQKRTWLKGKGGTSWLGVAFTFLFLFIYGFSSAFLLPTNVDHILTVKDGYFYEYPTTSVGDAFDDFFGDPNWEYVSSDSPFDIIRFTGSADLDGEYVDIVIDFIITEDSFEIHSSIVDGEFLTDDGIFYLVDAVFLSDDESGMFN
ncbi:MAG: hypothetical protein K0Q87_4692 [Neobacillus sp.]|jgi:hypothetical protein|nr:hypothetical protein [Neobacillus sp.]